MDIFAEKNASNHDHEIRLRELLVGHREDLVFAHYTTVGEPTRQFSVNDGTETTAELKWSYPLAESDDEDVDIIVIPDDGLLGRWWFTVIDQRGGTAWTERFVCVVP